MTSSVPPGRLPLELLRLADQLNDRALDSLERRRGHRLNRSEALVFAHIGPDGSTVAELARSAGMTKQSMHAIVERLVTIGLLRRVSSPGDRRRRPVVLTDEGRAVAADARRTFRRLEDRLAARIGHETMAVVRRAVVEMGDEMARHDRPD